MEAKTQRYIKSGAAYTPLLPKAALTDTTVKRGATVADTVKFIPQVVRKTRWQTSKLAQLLNHQTLDRTCENIWNFVYHHIRYCKDREGFEQVRSPARAWHDRKRGVDCDCYTVLISTILSNLGINHSFRITQYKEDRFQHIYPIVPLPDGTYITLDCVVDAYNYEEPFTLNKDYPMDLEFLEGLDGDLEGRKERQARRAKRKAKRAARKATRKSKGSFIKRVGKTVKKAVHVVNRVNPATVLLRNGVLAAMKLNFMKVAEKLKWGFIPEKQALAKGIIPSKYQRLKKVREKMEKIFYGAGGKPMNLRKAIMTGRGNKGKRAINGLEGNDLTALKNIPLSEVLGEELLQAEGMDEIQGLGALGEVATATAITAASGVIASLAALLKNIGPLFPKNKEQAAAEEVISESEATEMTPEDILANEPISEGDIPDYNTDSTDSYLPDTTDTDSGGATTDDTETKDDGTKKTFWEKNKKWLKPTLIGVGGLGLLYGGYKIYQNSQKKKQALSGTPKKKTTSKKPAAKRSTTKRKTTTKRGTRKKSVNLK